MLTSEQLLEDRTGAAIEGRGWTDGVPAPYVLAEMLWAALFTACVVAIEGCTVDADEPYRTTLFYALFHIVGLPGVMITAVNGGPRALLILMNYMAVVADVENTMRIFQRLAYFAWPWWMLVVLQLFALCTSTTTFVWYLYKVIRHHEVRTALTVQFRGKMTGKN